MPGIEIFTGATGGMMGLAYGMGAASATAGLLPLWKKFGENRIEELKAELASVKAGRETDKREYERLRAEDRAECREETRELRDRIKVLEAFFLQAGGSLRQATQAAISEVRIHREDGA